MATYNITLNDIDDGDDSAMSSVGHIIHEDPQLPDDSSDSAYNADTIIDSPTSTSSTLQLNLSEDSNDQNDVNDNDIDEDEVQMLEELPPAVVAAAAAASAANPIIIRNVDETGSQVCAMHSYKHLTSSCSGCACRCKATNIDGIVVDSESEEDEDPGFYALLADLHERNEEDGEREDEEREYEDAEIPVPRRRSYPMWIKDLVRLWRQHGLTMSQIKTNLADLGFHNVHSSTIAAWFSDRHAPQ